MNLTFEELPIIVAERLTYVMETNKQYNPKLVDITDTEIIVYLASEGTKYLFTYMYTLNSEYQWIVNEIGQYEAEIMSTLSVAKYLGV